VVVQQLRFILLGAVIEAVTEESYYDYVDEHIYEPDGMTGTGSLPEARAVPNRAVGYMDPSGGTDWRPNTDTLPYRGTSAGGGYSTVGDFARFADALLNHELLNPDSTELLITGEEEIGPGISYAYGFEDHRDAQGNGWVGHGGGAPGMNGDLRIYPASDYVVVVLANLDPPVASGSPITSTPGSRSTNSHAHRSTTTGRGGIGRSSSSHPIPLLPMASPARGSVAATYSWRAHSRTAA
jgi:D-alanyl-D-alanine carboxypeptidase